MLLQLYVTVWIGVYKVLCAPTFLYENCHTNKVQFDLILWSTHSSCRCHSIPQGDESVEAKCVFWWCKHRQTLQISSPQHAVVSQETLHMNIERVKQEATRDIWKWIPGSPGCGTYDAASLSAHNQRAASVQYSTWLRVQAWFLRRHINLWGQLTKHVTPPVLRAYWVSVNMSVFGPAASVGNGAQKLFRLFSATTSRVKDVFARHPLFAVLLTVTW